MYSKRFTYSVLVIHDKGSGLRGMYSNLKFAKLNAKVDGGKVVRFINQKDGSVLVSGQYVVLRGKL